MPKDIAIIGGGLAGLILSICLDHFQPSIKSTIYESHTPAIPSSSAVVLSPNSLRHLDRLGLYARLAPKCFHFEEAQTITEQGVVLDRHYYGHKRVYGYDALRVPRKLFLETLMQAVEERGIQIRYHSKYTGIVNEGPEGVQFRINDTVEKADLLIGADGIHSHVRDYVCPTTLEYGGAVALAAILPRNEIIFPQGLEPPAAYTVRGAHGAFMLIPQNPEGDMAMAAHQFAHPPLSPEEWSALGKDKPKLKSILQKSYGDWGETNRSIIDAMCRHDDRYVLWPFYQVPELERWVSPSGKVVLVGDGAHAVPPSSGQGVNQAVEDVYSLAWLLSVVDGSDGTRMMKDREAAADVVRKMGMREALESWQDWRKQRIRKIHELGDTLTAKRMPDQEKEKHVLKLEKDLEGVKEGEGEAAWLFDFDVDTELRSRFGGQSKL